MRYYEYKRIEELIQIFEEFWNKHTILNLGVNDGGEIKGVVDEKSGNVYLEKFDPITGDFELYKFGKESVPTTWSLDTMDREIVDLP